MQQVLDFSRSKNGPNWLDQIIQLTQKPGSGIIRISNFNLRLALANHFFSDSILNKDHL